MLILTLTYFPVPNPTPIFAHFPDNNPNTRHIFPYFQTITLALDLTKTLFLLILQIAALNLTIFSLNLQILTLNLNLVLLCFLLFPKILAHFSIISQIHTAILHFFADPKPISFSFFRSEPKFCNFFSKFKLILRTFSNFSYKSKINFRYIFYTKNRFFANFFNICGTNRTFFVSLLVWPTRILELNESLELYFQNK